MLNQSLENLFLSVFDNIFQKNIFIFQRSYFCRQSIYRCNFISPKLIKDTKFAAFIFVFVYLFFKLLLSYLFTERITYLVNTIKLAVVIYKVFKNRPNKICERQPLKGYGVLKLLGPLLNILTHRKLCLRSRSQQTFTVAYLVLSESGCEIFEKRHSNKIIKFLLIAYIHDTKNYQSISLFLNSISNI